MRRNRAKFLTAGPLVALLIGASLAYGAPAWAYSFTGCHWNTTSPTYKNNGGTAMSAEVTNAVGSWTGGTDLTTMTNSSSSAFLVGYSNMGATGYDGWTSWTCSGSTTTAANSRVNTYYTNSFTVAKRKAIWVHELGHGLGLGHSALANAIMNPCAACVYVSYGTNVPITDDINGMNSLY